MTSVYPNQYSKNQSTRKVFKRFGSMQAKNERSATIFDVALLLVVPSTSSPLIQ